MTDETKELVEALKMKIEALQIKNDALRIRLEVLEMGAPSATGGMQVPSQNYGIRNEAPMAEMEEAETAPEPTGKKRGRKPKVGSAEIKKMQVPLDRKLHEILEGERFNRATFRAVTGILLCLYENGSATVSLLNEYIGGSRVTIVRHTGLLKRLGLLEYVGSRKKGHYELTDKGRDLLNNIREQAS